MTVRELALKLSRKDRDQWRDASLGVIQRAKSGLTVEEIAELAVAVARSGKQVELPSDGMTYVDVASTGGPGSLSTLLCPVLLSSVGFSVPKISADGSVAGAIDTMALVPGYRADLSYEEFNHVIRECGFAHSRQSSDLCPADSVMIEIRRQLGAMENAQLAAISLIGKKLAVPGTCIMYDFRIGETGNIGVDFSGARQSARLFRDVGESVGVAMGIGLSDIRRSPTTVVGRLESFSLLWDALSSQDRLGEWDWNHVEECVLLAAGAATLASDGTMKKWRRELESSLSDGTARKTFVDHVVAQGGSVEGISQVLGVRLSQSVIDLKVGRSGYWIPPEQCVVKKWVKDIGKTLRFGGEWVPEKEVGIRYLQDPGAKVEEGEQVAEVRFCSDARVNVPTAISGRVVGEAAEAESVGRRPVELLV